ncbi:single-stranded DNA-binding protein [Lusitaniella coriacea]|uniref:single-stranded DNA-binding protein n=1 Tax=Lusitaniella coriacea TaxID=1983105 RepID=UPI003CF9DB64
MNSCVLMVRVVQAPEMRYTPDNQIPIAQMLVEFDGSRPEDPPVNLKVVGWGNLATEIQESYSIGDSVIIEGRLKMNLIDRDGYKEKRAELVASRLHKLGTDMNAMPTAARPSNVVPLDNYTKASPPMPETPNREPATPVPSTATPSTSDQDLDEIPF